MIETARLRIRPWRDSDRAPFAEMGRDAEVMRYLGPPLSREDSDAAIDRMNVAQAAHGFCFWALEQKADGAFIGFCGLLPVRFDAVPAGSIEAGWRLRRASWGQGYATEAARASLGWGFALGIESIIAFTTVANLPSQRVMQRTGMVRRADLDFHHPRLAADDPLRPHVVYEATP
ncbi:N-acetyltransferase [Polymorphobacter arshaanensis]|uniref:N-acetyltransferase n=1 Tax=Glacieibacterium arshaanense TaxID=2511025 RepID=A0A4Y9EQC3_9SPHN|nr:GNAT family N-acetyltransferase [Polymorphobacter arshaanensis]TFU05652.1 N-acetyltransferase [Polymorphobacter arshaanensis]